VNAHKISEHSDKLVDAKTSHAAEVKILRGALKAALGLLNQGRKASLMEVKTVCDAIKTLLNETEEKDVDDSGGTSNDGESHAVETDADNENASPT
jgi:hypothetical protein